MFNIAKNVCEKFLNQLYSHLSSRLLKKIIKQQTTKYQQNQAPSKIMLCPYDGKATKVVEEK